jgi:hypothetical protein
MDDPVEFFGGDEQQQHLHQFCLSLLRRVYFAEQIVEFDCPVAPTQRHEFLFLELGHDPLLQVCEGALLGEPQFLEVLGESFQVLIFEGFNESPEELGFGFKGSGTLLEEGVELRLLEDCGASTEK